MKPYLVILIFLGVLLQSVSKVLIVAEYAINKEYIAKNICENRDKPKMRCNGKCHLKKQLAAADEKGKSSNSQNQQEKQDVNLFCEYFNLRVPLLVVPVLKQKYLLADEFFILNYIKNIFHPPSGSFSF